MALLAVLVVAAGCALGEALQDPGDPVDMTTATIAGTWHAGTQRFITFNDNGTFTALNLPADMFEDSLGSPDPAAPPIDASGRYTLGFLSNATAGPHAIVELSIEHHTRADIVRGSAELDALRPGDGQVYLVFFYVGSQGNMTTGYLKCTSDCVLPNRQAPTAEPSGSPAPPGEVSRGPAPRRS
jgi:hypothetical protein